jgi:hypothetical protein
LPYIHTDGAVERLIEFETGARAPPRGVLGSLLQNQPALDEFGRNSRDRAFGEARTPCQLRSRELRVLAKILENKRAIRSSNLGDTLGSLAI